MKPIQLVFTQVIVTLLKWSDAALAVVPPPRGKLITVAPRDSAADAPTLLGKHDLSQLPVVEGERLGGLLWREDILKWLWLSGEDGHSWYFTAGRAKVQRNT